MYIYRNYRKGVASTLRKNQPFHIYLLDRKPKELIRLITVWTVWAACIHHFLTCWGSRGRHKPQRKPIVVWTDYESDYTCLSQQRRYCLHYVFRAEEKALSLARQRASTTLWHGNDPMTHLIVSFTPVVKLPRFSSLWLPATSIQIWDIQLLRAQRFLFVRVVRGNPILRYGQVRK